MENIVDIIKTIKDDIRKKQGKYIARKYYKYKPKNIGDEINTYSNGTIRTIKIKQNGLYTNYFKLIVKQKINYLLAKEPEIKIKNDKITVTNIADMLENAMLNASLDSTAWLHFYVENNNLEWVFVPDTEIIPIYDKYNKKIIRIIRYYPIEDEKSTDEFKKFKIETWDKNSLTINIIEKDKIITNDITTHYVERKIYQGQLEDEEFKNFPFIPFIPLFNNKDKESDIEGIHEQLDMYNKISSGFVENIEIFQEFLLKLKGFSGQGDQLEVIAENMKKYKIIAMPNGGGDNTDAEYMSVEIPVEARSVILEILKENIFKIGQGIDPDRLAGETNITNVVIKSRFYGLDTKANNTIKQLKLFYSAFIDCINRFLNTNYSDEINFNRSAIFNESEQIDNCVKSLNIIPLEKVLENHPWISNVKETKKLIEQENNENFKKQQEMLKNMKVDEITQ